MTERYVVTREAGGYAVWDHTRKIVVSPVYRSRKRAQADADARNAKGVTYTQE